jgi:hypothetical protein
VGTAAEQLTGPLDRLRTTFRWKADNLDAASLQAALAPRFSRPIHRQSCWPGAGLMAGVGSGSHTGLIPAGERESRAT